MTVSEKADPPSSTNPIRLGEFAEPHEDLRDWMDRAESFGELKRISGVNWDLEIGAVAEMIYHARSENPPALLFDDIPGYPKDYRILSGMTNSPRRLAMTLGLPMTEHPMDVVRAYRDRMKKFELIAANTWIPDRSSRMWTGTRKSTC